MRPLAMAAVLATLAACTPAPQSAPPPGGEVTARATVAPATLPPMKAFTGSTVAPVTGDNRRLAGDFLELAFNLETGRTLPVLSRFEGPVTVGLRGPAPAVLERDLDRLLARLRIEAGLDIRRAAPGAPAAITIDIIPKARLQALVPDAACFVAPNVSSWDEFRRLRGRPETDWARLTLRSRMAVFIPGDVAPQEMRDCLHEEIAQALGPVNDLYRLPSSVFNDDNFHTVLTGFDMLMLRAYYAPELTSGMSRAQVAARLPRIFARLNPAGGTGAPLVTPPAPADWKALIGRALGPGTPAAARRAAAARAVGIARASGWSGTRLALSLYARGRANLDHDSALALASFREAREIYLRLPGASVQAANMGVQLAAWELSGGRATRAIEIIDSHLPSARQAENAALLATLLLIRAEALDMAGRAAEARATRLDGLGWARYGFGSPAEVAARADEIAALARHGRTTAQRGSP